MPKVVVRQGESFENAFRKFKKSVESSGLLKELKERESYEKPTTRKKRKKAEAVKRLKKKLQEQQLPSKLY